MRGSRFDPLLTRGLYTCEITSVEVRASRSTPYDYLNWELTVLDDERDWLKRVWMVTSLSPKSRWKLEETFVALGVVAKGGAVDLQWADFVAIAPNRGPQLRNPDCVGLYCLVWLDEQEFNGSVRNGVKRVVGIEGESRRRREKNRRQERQRHARNDNRVKIDPLAQRVYKMREVVITLRNVNGRTPEEAAVFLQKADELEAKYGLKQTEGRR